MRKLIPVLMIVVLVLALAGCGQAKQSAGSTTGKGQSASNVNKDQSQGAAAGNAGKTASSNKSNAKVKLVYYSWDPTQEQNLNEMIQKFEKANPNIEVSLQAYKPSDYWTKLSAMAAAGNLPDVFDMSSGFVDEWAGKGLLYDLQPLVDKNIDKSKYFTSVFNAVRYPDKQKGDMYAFPYSWVTTVLFYNKTMFDKAHLSYPTKDWTWKDFLNAAQKLTVTKNGKTTQWGFWLYGRYAQIEPWVYQDDGLLLNQDKTKFQVNANGMETLKFLTDLTNKYKVSPTPKEEKGINQQDLFPMGKAAMWVDGSWNIANNRKEIAGKFKWGISTIPHGPHYKNEVTYGWPDNMAIAKTTKHADAAWKFIQFMTGKNRPVKNLMAGKVPIYKPMSETKAWLEKDKQPDNKSLILDQGKFLGRNSFTKNWSEWRGYGAAAGQGLNGELDQVFNGEKSLDKAISEATTYANQVISQSN